MMITPLPPFPPVFPVEEENRLHDPPPILLYIRYSLFC